MQCRVPQHSPCESRLEGSGADIWCLVRYSQEIGLAPRLILNYTNLNAVIKQQYKMWGGYAKAIGKEYTCEMQTRATRKSQHDTRPGTDQESCLKKE